MNKRLLGIKELAEYLAVKENTIYSWVSQRRIPHKKLGRLVRFNLTEIDEWLEKNSVESHPIY